MAIEPTLEARLLAAPDDRDAYLVYADWLSERGDPRGELIALQIRGDAEVSPAIEARARELIAQHGAAWLGPLAGIAPEDGEVTWRHGFLAGVRLGPPPERYETSTFDFPEAIAALARLESARLLPELWIGSRDYDDSPTSWAPDVEAIAEHGVPPGLRTLVIDAGGYWDISSTELGELAPAYPRLAELRKLRIRLGAMSFGDALELPALRELAIETGGFTNANLASLRRATWAVESLQLCLGDSGNDYGCDVELGALRWILDGENLPHVRHLGLANSNLADAIAAALVDSKILPRLATLDLSFGTFGEDGARAILDAPAAFAHLTSLDLSRAYLSDELAAALARALPTTRVILDDREGEADPDDRYCAIGE